MLRTFITSALQATALAALQALLPSCTGAEAPAAGRLDICFCVSADADVPTRGGAAPGELAVLLYDAEDGNVCGEGRGSAWNPVTLGVEAGRAVDYRAVVDVPGGLLSGLTTMDAYGSASVSLTDCVPGDGRFAMQGGGRGTFTAASEGSEVPVSVRRLASRVVIDTLEPRFVTSGMSVTLRRVFLLNVAASTPLDGRSAAPSEWVSRLLPDGSLPEAQRALLFDVRDSVLADSSAFVLGTRLYACPNPTDNGVHSGTEPEWSPRNTRIVVQMDIDGAVNYYPVTLPAMEGNTEYRIGRLILTGPGSDHPDIPVSPDRMRFGISVAPWGHARRIVDV